MKIRANEKKISMPGVIFLIEEHILKSFLLNEEEICNI